jgi:hypothetical protein
MNPIELFKIKKKFEELLSWAIYWERSSNKSMWDKVQDELDVLRSKYSFLRKI